MVRRCTNPESKDYSRYGGRGITVCERWKDVGAFVTDMGPRPSGMTLERKDNDIGYNPSNCVWADRVVQANNTSTNRMLEHLGRSQSVSAWAREVGLKRPCLQARLARGMAIEMALTLPSVPRGARLTGPRRGGQSSADSITL